MFSSDKEKEDVYFAYLKAIRNSEKEYKFLKKYRVNKKLDFWKRYDTLYGKDFSPKHLSLMKTEGLLDIDTDTRRYILSEKGEIMYKRGWIYHNIKWYDTGLIRKYSFIISILALIVAGVGSENIVTGLKWLMKVIGNII
ncbi:hypothetical protein [uncultured Dysgonomonas sp.]|uniref:Uncharacterized protein n=1 Tax=uncultured Dysgonomonas sp. TaxID=206096 RepID=A0A212K1L1_9BACT|nr:hypothetical protein [uncultured Dysgonomonas sp.]SBW05591.1 hypothetical protein KL86DYS1_31152 [uncultured Dysgonomonas sp.]